MSKSATRASAESTPPDSSMNKTHPKQHVANHAEHPRRLGVTSGARGQSRDGGERVCGAHSGWCAFRLKGNARGEKMNPVGWRIGPHLKVD